MNDDKSPPLYPNLKRFLDGDDDYEVAYRAGIEDVFKHIHSLNWDVPLNHLADSLGLSKGARKGLGL